MKTLTTEQFNALPEELRKYWKFEDSPVVHEQHYTPIQINLEDAERVLEEARDEIKSLQSGYSILDERFDIYDPPINILTAAINNLKQLTK